MYKPNLIQIKIVNKKRPTTASSKGAKPHTIPWVISLFYKTVNTARFVLKWFYQDGW